MIDFVYKKLKKYRNEINMKESFFKDIHFITPNDIVEEVSDGYSGAYIYKITKSEEKYFLKIFKGQLTEEKITKIKSVCEIYKTLKINSLEIIDFGNLDKYDKYYIIYNFVEGINLKKYTDTEKFDKNDIRKIGKKIGIEFLKLKQYENYDSDIFPPKDINNIVKTAVDNFNLIYEDRTYKERLLKYFQAEELNELKKQLIEFSSLLQKSKVNLIHGDIKRANIMVNKNKELIITDIESMQVSHEVLNFEYQITWCLFDKNEKEKEFVKGYFDGIYGNKRPLNFNYYIIFVIMLNFFKESYQRYKKSNIDGFTEYIIKCKNLFDKIKKADLNIEEII